MAAFGNRKKQEKKAPAAKRKSGTIQEINAATSAVEEEPGTEAPASRSAAPVVDAAPPKPLSGNRTTAYGEFNPDTYSEVAADRRKKAATTDAPSAEYSVDHEVGVVYTEDSGRDFYFDDYGVKHYADEVQPDPTIPESFEEARNSSSRERFQREAEKARQQSVNKTVASPTKHEVSSNPQNFAPPSGGSGATGGSYGSGSGGSGGSISGGVGGNGGFLTGGGGIQHMNSAEVVNLHSGDHIENPYAGPAEEINRRIERGDIAENFPTIDSTIASLYKSSRGHEDITKTLLGYLLTTLGGEGVEAAIKLLDEKNIYAPLLVSALKMHLDENPIEPVALRDLWELKPVVKVEKEVVYVKDKNAGPIDGEKGIWVPLTVEGGSPLYEELSKKHGLGSSESDSPVIRRHDPASLDY